MRGGRSRAVWIVSEYSSDLVALPVPYTSCYLQIVKLHHLLLLGFLHLQPVYLFLPTDHHFIEGDLLLGSHKRKCWKRLIRIEHWVIKKWKWKKSKLSVSCFERIHYQCHRKTQAIPSFAHSSPLLDKPNWKMKNWKITFKNADVILKNENI